MICRSTAYWMEPLGLYNQYRKASNIRCTLCNESLSMADLRLPALLQQTLLQLHLHSRLSAWFQWIGQRRDEKHLSIAIWCDLYHRFDGKSVLSREHFSHNSNCGIFSFWWKKKRLIAGKFSIKRDVPWCGDDECVNIGIFRCTGTQRQQNLIFMGIVDGKGLVKWVPGKLMLSFRDVFTENLGTGSQNIVKIISSRCFIIC